MGEPSLNLEQEISRFPQQIAILGLRMEGPVRGPVQTMLKRRVYQQQQLLLPLLQELALPYPTEYQRLLLRRPQRQRLHQFYLRIPFRLGSDVIISSLFRS